MAYLTNGYQSLIGFAAAPSILWKEVEVQLPGLSAGGEIDTTTMRNVKYRTRQPKKLVTAKEMKLQVEYDPASIVTVETSLLGVNNLATITAPDGHSVAVWGWVDDFQPQPFKEGERPLAEVTFIPSNQDNSGVETGPAYA